MQQHVTSPPCISPSYPNNELTQNFKAALNSIKLSPVNSTPNLVKTNTNKGKKCIQHYFFLFDYLYFLPFISWNCCRNVRALVVFSKSVAFHWNHFNDLFSPWILSHTWWFQIAFKCNRKQKKKPFSNSESIQSKEKNNNIIFDCMKSNRNRHEWETSISLFNRNLRL